MKTMPAATLEGWRAYFSIEPWEGHRQELLNAIQCASIHRDLTGESRPIEDWLPKFDELPQAQADRELSAALQAWEAISE